MMSGMKMSIVGLSRHHNPRQNINEPWFGDKILKYNFIFHETFPLASWISLEQDYRKLTQSELSLFGRKILNNSLSKQKFVIVM